MGGTTRQRRHSWPRKRHSRLSPGGSARTARTGMGSNGSERPGTSNEMVPVNAWSRGASTHVMMAWMPADRDSAETVPSDRSVNVAVSPFTRPTMVRFGELYPSGPGSHSTCTSSESLRVANVNVPFVLGDRIGPVGVISNRQRPANEVGADCADTSMALATIATSTARRRGTGIRSERRTLVTSQLSDTTVSGDRACGEPRARDDGWAHLWGERQWRHELTGTTAITPAARESRRSNWPTPTPHAAAAVLPRPPQRRRSQSPPHRAAARVVERPDCG
jgi:hypothetical protein